MSQLPHIWDGYEENRKVLVRGRGNWNLSALLVQMYNGVAAVENRWFPKKLHTERSGNSTL